MSNIIDWFGFSFLEAGLQKRYENLQEQIMGLLPQNQCFISYGNAQASIEASLKRTKKIYYITFKSNRFSTYVLNKAGFVSPESFRLVNGQWLPTIFELDIHVMNWFREGQRVCTYTSRTNLIVDIPEQFNIMFPKEKMKMIMDLEF